MNEQTITVRIKLPFPWPPEQSQQLLVREHEGTSINLRTRDDRLLWEIADTTTGDVNETFTSQPLILTQQGLVTLQFVWRRGQEADLWIGDLKVLLNSEDQPLMVHPTAPISRPPVRRSLANLTDSTATSIEEKLFINSIKDIEERLEKDNDYDLVKVGGILRLLLVDSDNLVHQVNRRCRIKLTFEVQTHPPAPQQAVPSALVNVSLIPDGFDPGSVVRLGLGKFLGWSCLSLNGKTVTVREVILACANSRGGVHVGHASDEGARALVEADNSTFFASHSISIHILRQVAHVALAAFEPLVEAISTSIVSAPQRTMSAGENRNVVFNENFKIFASKREHVENAIRNADIVQQISSTSGAGDEQGVSLFVKQIGAQTPFQLLVIADHKEGNLRISAVWRAYPIHVLCAPSCSALELLEKFVDVYGLPFTLGNERNTRFIGSRPIVLNSDLAMQISNTRNQRTFVSVRRESRASPASGAPPQVQVLASFAYAIDLALYYKHLGDKGVALPKK